MDNIQKLAVPIAIVIAGVLIAGAVYFASIGPSTGADTNSIGRVPANAGAVNPPAQPSVNIEDVNIEDEPFIGDINAPVELAYWSDHQCPFCKAVEVGGIPQIPITPAIPELIRDYVDTGKLKIVFKDYPFLGPDSMTAALYEHAVWELYPDKFYAWRKALMAAQDEENAGFGDESSILELTNGIAGMDGAQLKTLVAQKTEAYTKNIEADREEGTSFGIRGTPGFILGTKLIAGAVGPEAFKSAIEEQLK